LDADRGEGVAHLIQFEGLDNGHNDFQGVLFPFPSATTVWRVRGARVKSANAGGSPPTLTRAKESNTEPSLKNWRIFLR
jgi:hypothetical protein